MSNVPATAKKPADKKTKAEKVEADEFRTVTVLDREWKVPTEALADFELVDAFAQLQEGEDGAVTRVPFVLRRLIGDQWKDAMNALRDPSTGRVPPADAMQFMQDLLEGLNPNS